MAWSSVVLFCFHYFYHEYTFFLRPYTSEKQNYNLNFSYKFQSEYDRAVFLCSGL